MVTVQSACKLVHNECWFRGHLFAIGSLVGPLSSDTSPRDRNLKLSKIFINVIFVSHTACSIEGPLGMENKVIPDAAITASSTYENMIPTHGPQRSRLNTIGKRLPLGKNSV